MALNLVVPATASTFYQLLNRRPLESSSRHVQTKTVDYSERKQLQPGKPLVYNMKIPRHPGVIYMLFDFLGCCDTVTVKSSYEGHYWENVEMQQMNLFGQQRVIHYAGFQSIPRHHQFLQMIITKHSVPVGYVRSLFWRVEIDQSSMIMRSFSAFSWA